MGGCDGWREREYMVRDAEGRRGTSKGRGTDRRDTRRYGLYRWLKGAGAEGRKSQIGERVPRARWALGAGQQGIQGTP